MKETQDSRQSSLLQWVTQTGIFSPTRIDLLAGDASFRKYYRIFSSQVGQPDKTMVLVDAPPPESLEPFVSVALALEQNGVRVPHVFATNEPLGAMLLEDLGDELLLHRVDSLDARYGQAIDLLPRVMRTTETRLGRLPAYDQALLARENALFSDWLCRDYLELTLDKEEQGLWQSFHNLLVSKALVQPQVGVHRDFHSRNLMISAKGEVAAIDFQDAVVGPITYDLVSLLRDCYVDWPDDLVERNIAKAFDLLRVENLLPSNIGASQFEHDFDWMGMQRHVKASGIFARLYLRDGKSRYLQDIPHTVNYLVKVAERHTESREFGQWLQARVVPSLQQKIQPDEKIVVA